MRPLISYDDLADSKSSKSKDPSISPPKKKQKSNRNNHRRSGQGSTVRATVSLKASKTSIRTQNESKQLTHEDIWDDSALVAAWDAAAEEYEALNGPEKSWKTEPVKKAPLWYNIPPEQNSGDDTNNVSIGISQIPASLTSHFESSEEMVDENDDEANSRPLDFNTFVPQHDPSLSLNQNVGQIPFPPAMSPQALSSLSVDQAFQNAISAWYWAGYWTGIYHNASRPNTRTKSDSTHDEHGDNIEEEYKNDGEVETRSPEPAGDQTDFIPP